MANQSRNSVQDSVQKLIKEMSSGDRRALARIISLIEDRSPRLPLIIKELFKKTGHAFVLGVTGPPGAGKSTVTDKLVSKIRKAGQSVAIMAIDPSSPFSGGAILGDRIRMQSHHNDDKVYIRSLGTRGQHGGLSQASKEVSLALDAAGFDWIIVETAGVGQTELDILRLAHAVTVVLVPESGDSIQVMKAGLMEIADIFVVNKSDRPEADKLVRELINLCSSDHDDSKPWKIPVLKTQAVFDQGIDALFNAARDFWSTAKQHGIIKRKQQSFIESEINEIILNHFNSLIQDYLRNNAGSQIISKVMKKQLNPYDAANLIQSKIVD